MKAAVYAIKFFEALSGTGIRGKITAKFFSGLLKLIKPRAKRIDENLRLVYPESSEQWRRDLRNQVYNGLAWTLTEALALQRDKSQAMHWVKKVHGLENVNKVLAGKKGAVFLTAHFGNWELLGSWTAQYLQGHNREFYVLFQDMHDKDLSDYVKMTREHAGMTMINKDVSVMKLAHLLKSGAFVAALNDVSGTGKMRVPFMGHQATNMPGPAVMAMLAGVPVIPACCYRIKPFEHEAEFFEPVKLPDKSVSHDERLKLAVDACNKSLERFIKSKPELWFWLHNRWKG